MTPQHSQKREERIHVTELQYREAMLVVTMYWQERNRKVTTKMLEAEAYVENYINRNGCPPSYSEIAQALGLKSKSTAYTLMRGKRYLMKKAKQELLDSDIFKPLDKKLKF